MIVSAFADEIDEDPQVQVNVLLGANIRHLDLRSAWGTNVLDLSDAEVEVLIKLFRDRGISVASIASPLGKTPIDSPFEPELGRLHRALDLAQRFSTRSIRIFSFYGPSDGSVLGEAYRAEVLIRMEAFCARAQRAGIMLLHENEKDIFGESSARCAELCARFGGANFAAAFDPANFIQCGEAPYPLAYERLRPWIAGVHVKDATSDGRVVPAGEGEGQFHSLLQRLRDDGFDGPLSLEPHLATVGMFGGTTGPELFGTAASALDRLLTDLAWAPE